MKIAVIGSRGFTDYDMLKRVMRTYEGAVTQIISGGARGADALAEAWSKDFLQQAATVIEPKWFDLSHENAVIKYNKAGEKYDARAGLRRNEQIVQMADVIVAFWDGQSKGTKQTIAYAKQLQKTVKVVLFSDDAQMRLPFDEV